MARPSAQLKLSETELTELQTIIRSTKVESRLKQRAMIIMDWQAGKSYDETQELRKVSRRVVAKWRNRGCQDLINFQAFHAGRTASIGDGVAAVAVG